MTIDSKKLTVVPESPRELKLGHDTWNPNQRELTSDLLNANEGYIFIQAPTGTGKTVLPAALSRMGYRVLAVVETKQLQDENYKPYGADVLKGLANYTCNLMPDVRADRCKFKKLGMRKCLMYDECNYVNARKAAMASNFASFNYALWHTFAAKFPDTDSDNAIDYLVLDEAHNASQIVRAVAGCKLTRDDRDKWDFDEPRPRWKDGGEGFINAYKYLKECKATIDKAFDRLSVLSKGGDKIALTKFREAEKLRRKIEQTLQAMELMYDPQMWYIKTEVDSGRRGNFIIKPITASFHADAVLGFSRARKVVFMSATMQRTEIRIAELGLRDQWEKASNVVAHDIPSIWTPDQMPIDNIAAAPSMGARAMPTAFSKQAELMHAYIKDGHSSRENVLVLTRSKKQAFNLARRLANINGGEFQDRIWTSDTRRGTDSDARSLQNRLRKGGAIAVTWRFWTGYDGVDIDTLMIAKAPYTYLGEYERMRQRFNSALWYLDAADDLCQGLGRNRRHPSHYRANGNPGRRVAIFDSSWKRLRNYMPQYIVDSVVDY